MTMMTMVLTLMKKDITRAKFIIRFITFLCCSFPVKSKKKMITIARLFCLAYREKKKLFIGRNQEPEGRYFIRRRH